jgi:MoaD family protein
VLKLIVKVLFFTSLREITGKKEESLKFAVKDKVTINMILKMLNERYGTPFEEYIYDPKTHNVRGFLQFLINGKSLSSFNNAIETKLDEGDVLAILPPVGGG